MIRLLKMAAAVAAAGLSIAPAAAAVQTYNFTLGGFTGGGTLTGSFAGDDLDADGVIDLYDGSELVSLSGSFTGDANVPNLAFNQGTVASFNYAVGSSDFSGIVMAYSGPDGQFYAYGAGGCDGAFFDCAYAGDPSGLIDSTTMQLGSVAVAAPGVPGPVLGFGLIPTLAALAALAAALPVRRRRRGALAVA